MILLSQINWYGQGGSAVAETFEDVQGITIRRTSEASASTAEITLANPIYKTLSDTTLINKYVGDDKLIKFNEGDIVKIYLAYDTSTRSIDTSRTSADLMMTAEISEIEVNVDTKKSTIKLRCIDKTYTMLNKLWAFNYDNSISFTAPEIVQDVVRQISDDHNDLTAYDGSGNFVSGGIYAIDARLVSSNGFIEDTRPDGSVFPTAIIAKTYKPAYEFLLDASKPENTNTTAELDTGNPPADRSYVFYVDELNRLHWFYPRDAVSTTLNGAINSSVTTITLTSTSGLPLVGRIVIENEWVDYTGVSGNNLTGCSRGVANTTAAAHSTGVVVSNRIVIIAGNTSTGFNVLSYKLTKKTFDIVNMVIFNAGKDLNGSGILSYFYDENTESKELKMVYKPYTEISKELIQAEIDAGNLIKDDTTPGEFVFDNGHFYTNDTYNFATTWGTTVTSDTTYNTAVRDQAESIGKSRAENLTHRRGSPRWKGSIDLEGIKFNPNDLIRFTSSAAGIYNQELRIKQVTHQIDKSGWFTTIDVEEDERKRGD